MGLHQNLAHRVPIIFNIDEWQPVLINHVMNILAYCASKLGKVGKKDFINYQMKTLVLGYFSL